MIKNLPANGDTRLIPGDHLEKDPWISPERKIPGERSLEITWRKIPGDHLKITWRKKLQPIPVFLPGNLMDRGA